MTNQMPKQLSKHDEHTGLKDRHLAEGVTGEEVLAETNRLLNELQLTPLNTFDTARKTEGKKSVLLCRDTKDNQVILRVGERRPDWFFPEGYVGEYIRVPKCYAAGGDRIPYEVEECIPGQMIQELPVEVDARRKGQNSPETWEKLIPAFWEFQRFGQTLPTEHIGHSERLHEFITAARELISDEAKAVAKKYMPHWDEIYPAKWKFATDNLLIDEDGKIVFIDNANVSGRYFAFDIAWIIWPRWVEMDTDQFANADQQIAYLDSVKEQFLASIPADVHTPQNPSLAFDLMIFERLIGSLYDVARDVRHFEDWGMAGEEGRERREAHRDFLQALLAQITTRL